LYNPYFKHIKFDVFKKQAGLNSFVMTPKKWIEITAAVGIISKSGMYSGTFAHKDIALNLLPGFQLNSSFTLLKNFND